MDGTEGDDGHAGRYVDDERTVPSASSDQHEAEFALVNELHRGESGLVWHLGERAVHGRGLSRPDSPDTEMPQTPNGTLISSLETSSEAAIFDPAVGVHAHRTRSAWLQSSSFNLGCDSRRRRRPNAGIELD